MENTHLRVVRRLALEQRVPAFRRGATQLCARWVQNTRVRAMLEHERRTQPDGRQQQRSQRTTSNQKSQTPAAASSARQGQGGSGIEDAGRHSRNSDPLAHLHDERHQQRQRGAHGGRNRDGARGARVGVHQLRREHLHSRAAER